ncbi:hypothetical protein ACFE04_019000 [Oxalis oulophora]
MVLHVLCFLLFFFNSAISFSFKITRFEPNQNNILYQRDAAASVGAIEFNKLSYLCRVGWATYADPVRLWDSETEQAADFSSHFIFSIDTQGNTLFGHGLVFFLAPVGFQIPLNSGGGFLGLFNTTTCSDSSSSLNQIIAIEFDTFNNPEWDPTGVDGHVGINNNSIASAVYTPWNVSLHSGDTADMWIYYNSRSKNLSVSWSFRKTTDHKETSSLYYIIDLKNVLPELVTVGFSAATGQNVERHILKSWEFDSSLERGRNIKIIFFNIIIPIVASLAFRWFLRHQYD